MDMHDILNGSYHNRDNCTIKWQSMRPGGKGKKGKEGEREQRNRLLSTDLH